MDYRNSGRYDSSRGRETNNQEGGSRPRFSTYKQNYSRQQADGNSPRPRTRTRFSSEQGSREQGQYNREQGGFNRVRPQGQSEFRPQGQRPTPRKRMRPTEDYTKPVRLNKFLANAGICSRREADDFIQAGVITVNGETVTTLGARVLPTDKVMFHDQPIRRERKVYILLNKPKNCVTTTDDPQERKTVLDIVRNACAERIYPVGRLDRNTTGVLMLTNDGDLAAKLTHPKYGKRKIYAATIDRDLTEEDYRSIMQGVTLDDEVIIPDAMEFTKDADRRHIGLEIHSGQNRVVRRIFEKMGYKVLQLDRVSFAGLTKKGLGRGKYRFLTPKEVAILKMGSFE